MRSTGILPSFTALDNGGQLPVGHGHGTARNHDPRGSLGGDARLFLDVYLLSWHPFFRPIHFCGYHMLVFLIPRISQSGNFFLSSIACSSLTWVRDRSSSSSFVNFFKGDRSVTDFLSHSTSVSSQPVIFLRLRQIIGKNTKKAKTVCQPIELAE